jgi:hypothetical protein
VLLLAFCAAPPPTHPRLFLRLEIGSQTVGLFLGIHCALLLLFRVALRVRNPSLSIQGLLPLLRRALLYLLFCQLRSLNDCVYLDLQVGDLTLQGLH